MVSIHKTRLTPGMKEKLIDLDGRIFSAADAWDDPELFEGATAYIIRRDDVVVGWLAFYANMAFIDGNEWDERGSLYLGTTGILPEFRGLGIEELVTEWQISYATTRGFKKISTNERASSSAVIENLKRYGFKEVRRTKGYWVHPGEENVVLELALNR